MFGRYAVGVWCLAVGDWSLGVLCLVFWRFWRFWCLAFVVLVCVVCWVVLCVVVVRAFVDVVRCALFVVCCLLCVVVLCHLLGVV